MSIHISQFYSCSKISYACELYYACELGKHLMADYNEALSLDGVILVEDLKKSIVWDLFRIAVDKGWVVDTSIPTQDIAITIQHPLVMDSSKLINIRITEEPVQFNREDYQHRMNDAVYNYTEPKVSQIVFREKSDELWVWDAYGVDKKYFNVNNATVGGNQSYMALVSLIAYVAVKRLKTGVPKYFGCEFDGQTILNGLALSYIDILLDKTECFGYKDSKGNIISWFNYRFNNVADAVRNQLGYYAWYMMGKDMGYFEDFSVPKDKLAYMKDNDIREGDFVMLYKREKQQKTNYMKSIASCHLACIKSIKDLGVIFEIFHTTKPYYQGKYDFDDNTTAIKAMYQDKKPYEKLNTSEESIDFTNLGVEFLLSTETYFIMRLSEVGEDGGIYARVHNGTKEAELNLTQNDLVYWICKDYGYKFDEERFLSLHFPKTEPMYTRFMRGDELNANDYWKKAE